MKTLQVSDGDLVLANGAFATITGPQKVNQDIEIGVLTPYGSDRFHPRYGSVFSNYIGIPVGPGTAALIKAELTRVINNYQRVQLYKIQQANLQGLASPFSQGEVVTSIGKIDVAETYDSFNVAASVNTSSGNSVNVSTTVTG